MGLNEIKKEAHKIALNKNYPYRILVLSKISPYFTYLFSKTTVTPNQITVLGFIVVIISAYFISYPSPIYWIVGWSLLQLYLVLDCVDGELARYKKSTTKFGGFLDNFLHPISNALIVIGAGISSYNSYDKASILYLTLFSLLIVLTLSLFRLNTYLIKSKSNMQASFKKRNPLIMIIISPGGFFHPIVILALAEIIQPKIPYRIIYIPSIFIAGFIILFTRIFRIYRSLKDVEY